MEPKRTLHSGNLVRGFHVGDRKLFMEKYYDPEKYMELGTCFVREDILLRDGRKKNELGRLGDFRSKEEERFIKKLVDARGAVSYTHLTLPTILLV